MENAEAIADSLSGWEKENGRRPQWRETTDAYRLAVAEILLQKTKALDVEPVWVSLLAQYPTAQSLSDAPDADVREVVGRLGLGAQRARRLKAMASAITFFRASQTVPGLGPYGSAMVALASANTPTNPPVDGNIARVIVRVSGLHFDRGEARKKPEVRAAVASLLATRRTVSEKLEVVYGLVDLGGVVCTPRRPRHAGCPLFNFCASRNL